VAARGEPIERLRAFTHRGGLLVDMPYCTLAPGACAYGLHRGDLIEVLHEQVVGQGVPVRLAHEMRAAGNEGDNVFLTCANGRRHGPFDFVLACDGARSKLRRSSPLAQGSYEYGYGALWLIGRCSAVERRLHQVVRNTTNLLGLLPMGGGRCSLFWLLHRRDKEAVLRGGIAAWKEQVVRLCPLAEELFDGLNDFSRAVYTTYHHVWMPRGHDRRVLFLGDSGHAMSPHLGQGVNLALIDAAVFADCLARARDHREAFRAFARRRAAHLRFFRWVTFLLTPFFQGGGRVLGWGRDLALPRMPLVPWVRRQMALTMAGLKAGFLSGEVQL
jgi:2-polyprenyl-6-methoxyphenol hydroxylase-like FAD-dependent oxidoreductase